DGSAWWEVTGGDGMDNAISPVNDYVQVSSYQYGNFFLSLDRGSSFSAISFSGSGTGSWVSPVVFNPRNPDTIYFGLKNIYASYDAGATVNSLSTGSLFTGGAKALAVAQSDVSVLYAADNSRVMRTTDGGTTWVNISSGLPTFAAKTFIAVDYTDPMKVYVTTSGYSAANKVFMSTNGGTTWTNISAGLPNLPANCIAVDSTTPGALFVGTDMGMYYKDDTLTSWAPYSIGLPNVIVDDIDINYTNYKIRVATYGRGVWECKLRKDAPLAVTEVMKHISSVSLFPNPTVNSWKVVFSKQKPQEFSVRVMDAAGRTLQTHTNKEIVDASGLAKGIYYIEVTAGDMHESIKAVRY
ncbi:MAG: T9SS type A sorting domain-containing protein, partial [Taibaiella sp.]|nr:T9SS type A sorting domain-containing protein [Taibaiella sp.]